MNKNKINYLYSSSSENVNWLLNIRGNDLPNSPIVNCKAIISEKGKLYLFIDPRKIPNLNKINYKNIILCEENDLFKILFSLNKGYFVLIKALVLYLRKN